MCKTERGVPVAAVAVLAVAGAAALAVSRMVPLLAAACLAILGSCLVLMAVTGLVYSRRRLPVPQFSEWVVARTAKRRRARPVPAPARVRAALTTGPPAIERDVPLEGVVVHLDAAHIRG